MIKIEGILVLYKGFIFIWVRLGFWNIIVFLVLIFDFEVMGIMNCIMIVYWEYSLSLILVFFVFIVWVNLK